MLIKQIVMVIFGLSAGLATASGFFAVIASIGVITRFAQYTHTAYRIKSYESMVIAGAAIGNAAFIFMPKIKIWPVFAGLFAVASGIFIGCFLVSLAEVVKGIPIFFRRTGIQKGLAYIILFFALGKGIGSLFYFIKYTH